MNNILRILILAILLITATHLCAAADKPSSDNKAMPEIASTQKVDSRGNRIYKYTFINKDEVRITDYIFDKVFPFSSNGLALVYINGFYGFIDTKGEYFIKPGMRDARPYDEFGLAAVKEKDKWGIINSKNQYVIADIFDKIEPFQSTGLAIVKYEGKYGLVDTLGYVVLPIMYDKIDNFDKSGFATLKIGDKFGILDKRGRAVIAPEYKDKKSALAALSEIKSKKSKQDITLADISRINNITTTDVNAEPAPTQTPNQTPPSNQDEAQVKLLAEKARKEEEQRLLEEQQRKE